MGFEKLLHPMPALVYDRRKRLVTGNRKFPQASIILPLQSAAYR